MAGSMPIRLVVAAFLVCAAWQEGVAFGDEYAGAASCQSCHQEVYEQYSKSGHPYKIQRITGSPPSFPTGTSPGVPSPPESTEWDDILYVIGGFGWKARFIDREGYVLTGPGRQYNLPNSELGIEGHWVAYDSGAAPRKAYSCGDCHTTGWEPSGIDGPFQHDLPGIRGVWAEPGVTCEGCHGPSAAHVAAPTEVVPTTAENCIDCHSRGEPTQIDASGGLIRHHEQYEDLLASPHAALACSSCHDPHKSTKYDLGGFKGTEATCGTCHSQVEINVAREAHGACESCHMPFAVKSAVSTAIIYDGGTVPKGDLRTHIQSISTDPDWTMFLDSGEFVRLDDRGKAHLTLDYVCLSCHIERDLEWAYSHAGRIH